MRYVENNFPTRNSVLRPLFHHKTPFVRYLLHNRMHPTPGSRCFIVQYTSWKPSVLLAPFRCSSSPDAVRSCTSPAPRVVIFLDSCSTSPSKRHLHPYYHLPLASKEIVTYCLPLDSSRRPLHSYHSLQRGGLLPVYHSTHRGDHFIPTTRFNEEVVTPKTENHFTPTIPTLPAPSATPFPSTPSHLLRN